MVDVPNQFYVGSGPSADILRFFLPPQPGQPLSRHEALLLAAWLVVLAETEAEPFAPILQAVKDL